MSVCHFCISDYHEFCETVDDTDDTPECCCRESKYKSVTVSDEALDLNINPLDQLLSAMGGLDDTDLPDISQPLSETVGAGRKRAARLGKIPDGTPCEWTGLLRAGGGILPIVGCRPSSQSVAKHRHHGPDKSTVNNERHINLHWICHFCHNRWHTLNDDYYGIRDQRGYLPKEEYMAAYTQHDAETLATEDDYKANDAFWLGRKMKKVQDEDSE